MFKLPPDKKSFIPFIMAGVPDLQTTKEALLTLDKLGVAAIELGVPFTDPIADGPVNQEAAMIGLSNQVSLNSIFNMLLELQKTDFNTPLILFTYFNPILSLGFEFFIVQCKRANVQAVLMVDLPIEEGAELYQALHEAGISTVLLVSPTTPPERYQKIAAVDSAFIYYISRCAVTGMHMEISQTLKEEIDALRTVFTAHAIAVGFGISTGVHAQMITTYADGVIVGSALMTHLNRGDFESFKRLSFEIQHVITEVNNEKI